MNDIATLNTETGTGAVSSCEMDSYVIQYQPVYDRDYVLRAMRLQRGGSADIAAPTWSDVVTHYPDAFAPGLGPLLVDIAPADQPDALAEHLRRDDLLNVDRLVGQPQALAQWAAIANTHGALLAYGLEGTDAQVTDGPAPVQLIQGISTLDQLDAVWTTPGAQYALGWPVLGEMVVNEQNSHGESNIQLILELMQRIDQAEHVDNIEPLLDQSPTLSYRLLRYLNSPASGLGREIDSLRHAVMLVGYGQLKSWLSMLLATAVESPRARPLIDASIRRAHLMQEFADRLGISQTHGDMFVCGVFSLLDQILGKPMTELLATLPLSDEAAQCLTGNDGPYAPYLQLVRQLESDQAFDFRAACDTAALTVPEVNQSIISSLKKAHATS
jgi:hypothetical protein